MTRTIAGLNPQKQTVKPWQQRKDVLGTLNTHTVMKRVAGNIRIPAIVLQRDAAGMVIVTKRDAGSIQVPVNALT